MERLGIRKQLKGFFGAIPVCALITICLEVGLAFLHRGGSIEKHLIHFAILLLAAWGMVLLYGAVPSVRRIWKRIDREILSVEKRKPWVDVAYAVFAMIMLLHHFYVLLYYPKLPAGASRFAPVWIPFAVITVLMGKMWKNKGFWICIVLAAYLFERTYIENPNLSGETMVYMVSAIYALIICFGAIGVIRSEYRQSMLRVLCAIWTIGILAFCAAGLYFAWTGIPVSNLGNGVTQVITEGYGGKIRLIIFGTPTPTITAGIIVGGAMFTLIGVVIEKNVLPKILYIAASLPMLVTNALTDTRSCFYMISFAFAGIVTLGVWGIIKRKMRLQRRGNVLLSVGLTVCFFFCFLLALAGQQKISTKFVEIRDQGGLLVSSAEAEEIETSSTEPLPNFGTRDITTNDINQVDRVLNGRRTIWIDALKYLQNHPEKIVFGLSAGWSYESITENVPHCHNILLQFLMESGIIGLALYLWLLGHFFCQTCRLWRRWDLPLWQRSLPLPVLAIMMMEMVECLTHFGSAHVPMTVMYFFMGATISISRSLKDNKQNQDSSTPALPMLRMTPEEAE